MDDQQQVIAFLSRAESYGERGAVERIDTHAAIVFLAGSHAFKLKRSVRYPYLDFSTPERRKAACEAEIVLNRRTAPEMYLEIRSINRGPDGALTFGPGKPVDWLLVMRRFDQQDLMEAVAGSGRLTPELIRMLAAEIARFHDAAEVIAQPNAAAAIGQVIDGNRASMAELPPGCLSRAEARRLHEASGSNLSTLAPMLDRRGATGHVRHCHGDLHLTNICLWQGRPVLFDCLEFDPALARTDVLYDLAFLIMDLWEKGHCGAANLLLNRYLDLRDEQAGLAALPLFMSVRAAVRAHVEGAAALRQANGMERGRHQAAARRYLDHALAFLQTAPARLIAIGGLSGAGKSTLAQAMAPRIGHAPGARVLRTDVIRKRLMGVAPESRLAESAYDEATNRRVYAALTDHARQCLKAGNSVIADAVFARPEERAAIEAVAREQGCQFDGLWLKAARHTLIARVGVRQGDASDATPEIVDRQLGYAVGDLGGWTALRTEDSVDELAARTIGLLSA